MIKTHGWLGRNSLRAYPLREDAPRQSINSSLVLPNSLLADAFILAPDSNDDVYISSVSVSARIISVCFSSVTTGEVLGYASAIAGVDAPYCQKQISPIKTGTSGYVSFGSILEVPNFSFLPQGQHLFSADLRLEARTVMATGSFPVKTLGVYGSDGISGSATLSGTAQMVIETSEETDEDGDPITYILMSLLDPAQFLSPCETPTSPCQCTSVPITSINGVTGDPTDGRLTIEILDEDGQIILLSPSVLNFLLTRPGGTVCERTKLPDDYGRLPDAAGNYTTDEKPVTEYKAEGDTTFPEPKL